MSSSGNKKTILIALALIILLISSVVMYFYLKPRHHAIPVYKQLPEDVFKSYFHVGQTRYFTKGALYCASLADIKLYYDYMNARNLPRAIWLVVTGDCNYSSEDKVYAVLEEVTGMFAKVKPQGIADIESRWMPALELGRD